MSQNNHLMGSKMPDSFKNQRWRDVSKQSKRPLILQLSPTVARLRQENVLISFLPCPDGQGPEQRRFSLTDRQRGRIL